MASGKLLGLLALLLILIPFSSAATCAEKSYTSSCAKCGFEASGKMDEACFQGYQARGTACLAAAYPAASFAYQMGSCPAIQTCIDRLQECKAIYTNGNDKNDCELGSIDHCFERGDACVAAAAADCNKTPSDELGNIAPPASWCDGFFFTVLLPLSGAAFFRMKQ